MLALLMMLLPAQANDGICQSPGTVVHFTNGMNNTYAAAYGARLEIERSYRSELESQTDDEPVYFELRYNFQESFLVQLEEVSSQWVAATEAQALRWFAGSFTETAPAEFVDAFADLVEVAENIDDADLVDHAARYQQLHLEGNRQLIVAHSQGSLYANAAYATLGIDDGSLALVFAGSPAHTVAGGGTWVENEDDLVGLVGALPSNANNADDSADFSQHRFLQSYLWGDDAGPKLRERVLQAASNLETPARDAEGGPITVTLTWGSEPDLDLHVFEPDGTHVYYSNPTGSHGYLDVDDTTSFGPEHYFVSCEDLETGVFDIGVNYYSGFGPEVAQVLVAAGYQVESFEVPLSESVGTAGNLSPIHVASVDVSHDGSQWSFRID